MSLSSTLSLLSLLRSVVPAVHEDTIVFVFGDHGMTPTGDHGGETELETGAALLVYSPLPLFDPQPVSHYSLLIVVYCPLSLSPVTNKIGVSNRPSAHCLTHTWCPYTLL